MPSSLRRVTPDEFAKLLKLYPSVDDLAQDLSLGQNHEQLLPEIWGMVKGLGEPKDGLRGYPAYVLPPITPLVVIESDGTVLPYSEWCMLAEQGAV